MEEEIKECKELLNFINKKKEDLAFELNYEKNKFQQIVVLKQTIAELEIKINDFIGNPKNILKIHK